MTQPEKKKCPYCICTKCVKSGQRDWYCPNCQATFDDSNEDGGLSTSANNPEYSAIRKEEYEARKRKREGRFGRR